MNAAALIAVLLGPSPVIVPPPNSLSPAGSSATGSGVCVGTDSVLRDNNGTVGCQKLSDVAPQPLLLRPQPAFAGGTQTAAQLVLAGGPDETKIRIDAADPSVTCPTDTVTVTRIIGSTSTATVLTEGTNWNAVASVATTCANLATAVDALSGVGATCTSPDVLITIDTDTAEVTLAESDGNCTGATAGTQGGLTIRGPITTSNSNHNLGTGTVTMQTIQGASNILSIAGTTIISLGADGSNGFYIQGHATNDQAIMRLGSGFGRALHIVDGTYTSDCTTADQTNPTVYFHSATACSTSQVQEVHVTHDTANGVIGTGLGELYYYSDETKGAATGNVIVTQSLTFAANPGDATKVTSGLVPDGAFLHGITTRVTTTATNCTSVSIGDGTDVDMFGATTGITQNTTTNNSNATAQFGRSPATAAMEVTITANGGNCYSGVWAVTAHYTLPSAATSN